MGPIGYCINDYPLPSCGSIFLDDLPMGPKDLLPFEKLSPGAMGTADFKHRSSKQRTLSMKEPGDPLFAAPPRILRTYGGHELRRSSSPSC